MFTDKQIAALRYLIFNAKNGTNLSKRILAFLIESSEKLTKDVCLSLVADREGYTDKEINDAAYGVDGMQSCNGTTYLDQILHAMGSELRFSVHYGDFDPARIGGPFNNDGQFVGCNIMRYTFWLSKKSYSQQATLVVATNKELEQISLEKPGLYPSLEPA